MSVSPDKLNELQDLAGRLCNEELDREEFSRLEALLDGDPHAQEFYVRYIDMHHSLRGLAVGLGEGSRDLGAQEQVASPQPSNVAAEDDRLSVASPAPGASVANSTPSATPPLDPGRETPVAPPATDLPSLGEIGDAGSPQAGMWSSLRLPTLLLVIAVALLAGGAIGWSLRQDGSPSPIVASGPELRVTPVAFLSANSGCSWGQDSVQLAGVGSILNLGEHVTLYEGIAEFRLSSEVTLSIEGPVAFVITSPTTVALRHGKMTVYVPEEKQRFQVSTSSCTVDAGHSEFGLHVVGNKLAVHSFWGDVLVEPAPNPDWIEGDRIDAAPMKIALDERDLPSGTVLTRSIIQPRRALALIQEGDQVRVANWSAARNSEFATKITMSRELPISGSYVDAVLQSKPIGYWRFENLRDGLAKNEIPGGVDLKVVGNARLWGNIYNRVLDFRQVDSDAYLIGNGPMNGLGRGDYSVELWLKPSHFHRGTILALMENPDVELGNHGFLLETLGSRPTRSFRTPKKLRFLHRDPPTDDLDVGTSCVSRSSYRVQRWQHVVAVKEGESMRLYVNGVQVAKASESSTLAPSLYLVMRWTAGKSEDRFFFGQLDELAIYNRALRDDEIQTHSKSIRWARTTASTGAELPSAIELYSASSI